MARFAVGFSTQLNDLANEPLVDTPYQILIRGTNTPATIYLDRDKTPFTGTLITSSYGNASFFVDPGYYDIKVGGNDRVPLPYIPEDDEDTLSPGDDVGFVVRGAWEPNTNYVRNDIVTHEGSTYRALGDFTSGTDFSGTFLEVWAAKGDQGIQGPGGPPGIGIPGPQGPIGPQGPQGSAAPVNLTWRGSWDSATEYEANDIVKFGDAVWFALTPSVGSEPAEDSDDWATLPLVEVPGPQGAQGPPGEPGIGTMGPQGPQGIPGPPGATSTEVALHAPTHSSDGVDPIVIAAEQIVDGELSADRLPPVPRERLSTEVQQMLAFSQNNLTWAELAGIKTWGQITDMNMPWEDAANMTWGQLAGISTWQRAYEAYETWEDASLYRWNEL